MVQLSRRLSPMTLFMLSMNVIIGSGWLFAPLYVAKIAGPAAVFSWMIGGAAAILIALTFAEVSTMFPVAGGTAHIPQLSHGTFASFIFSWVAWITALMLAPIEVQAVLQYASVYFPFLMHMANGAATLTAWGYLWATILMLTFCLINVYSYKGLVRFNFIIFGFKILVMIFTIFTLLKVQFNPANFTGMLDSATTSIGWQSILSAVATGGVVLAFNGFKNGVEMAGETKNLAIAIPLSTVGSVIACLILYLGLQICFIGALNPAALSNGWHSLSFTGDIGPFAGLAAGLGIVWLVKLLYIDAVVSPSGAGLIYVTSTARILYAMSKIGFVPKFLSHLNRHHFPVWAIVINFVLGMLSFLPLPGWQAMVNFLISAIIITYAMGPISLLCFRQSLPKKERPFYLPAANILCFLAFYCCNLFSYWTGWDTISKLAIILLIGLVIFSFACIKGHVKFQKEDMKSVFWILPYLGGLIIISYLGSFGGLNIIPFGWDFLIIGLFSTVILYMAIQMRRELKSETVKEYFISKEISTEYS